MQPDDEIAKLKTRIKELEIENSMLKRDFSTISNINTVNVPEPFKPLFEKAQQVVGEYFQNLKMNPNKGTIEINDQRYVLVRASALSTDFLLTIKKLYADRGDKEAISIGKNFLFDIAHVIGINDAVNFHTKMNLTDPIAKLSAGPVHFAYSGWAYVDIMPESNPSPDDDFYLIYNHPFSFEADSWLRSGNKTDTPVCIMNAGYSSGWCEQSFGIPLTAVEVTCKAKGDENCTFIMSPPHMIHKHLEKFEAGITTNSNKLKYDVPTFFERKKVEEEMNNARIKAIESDKAKSEFLANMSHEIRTPMNAIIGYLDLILDDNLNQEHRKYLEIVKDSGHMLLSLINDILDLSKIEAGQITISPTVTSIKELFRNTETLAWGIINSTGNNVVFCAEIDQSLSDKIFTDAIRLQQVLNNLISNAIKFTNKGEIKLSVSNSNGLLQFYIQDSGIGIDASDFEKIFSMFGQADTSNTRKYGGTGLGLTICKKIIDLMGGKIWVESTPEKGSIFYFNIPLVEVKESAENTVVEEKSEPIHTVLMVEDNIINQKLTQLILEKSGFNVVIANNGLEAVEIYQNNKKIKFILMDIQMPVMDGITATKKIREIEHSNKNTLHIPIVALTAHAMAGDREMCINAGCDDYLTKPVNIELLSKTIKYFIK